MQADLQAALGGDRDALGRLLDAETGSLQAALQGRIPPRLSGVLSIEDVIQQTYTDAFLDIARFEPRDARSFANWLRTIAEHNLQDAIRLLTADRRGGGNVQHREATSHSDLFERITGSLTTASQHVARDEAAEALRAGLTQLPECHREVITRIDLDGEPVADVARDLKRSPGSVYMMRARAHRWLRDLLDHGSQVLPDFS